MVTLIRATEADAELLWQLQVESFRELLDRYQDFETNPACESLDRFTRRITAPGSFFYHIRWEGKTVGAIRVVELPDGGKKISPLFLLPRYRGRGLAQAAIREVERLHGSDCWELATILQEAGNCHLYEKMGYRPTGGTKVINDRMTLVFYRK